MKKYSAYNLIIESDRDLPLQLVNSSAQADIMFITAAVEEPRDLCRTYDGVWYAHDADSLFLRWDIIGSFLIQQGRKITFSPSPLPQTVSPVVPLLGTVMAIALHQRGLTALHGSSVLVNGAALVFLGEKGEGKSTLAAYFHKHGNDILSDDVCAIDILGTGSPLVYPSFSKIKLWPDSMLHFGYVPENYERVHLEYEKRNMSLGAGFCKSPSLLEHIIVLNTGSETRLKPLSGHHAIPLLIPHLIINRFHENQPKKLVMNAYEQLIYLIK